ncbi:MAG: phosphoribosylaminoimidazolesuccinocarboxamide synthase, partial [Acidobacteriota bacterium]
MRALELDGISRLGSGKVREIFDLGENLLLVATDRISAFDVVLPDQIPFKGHVLNQLSAFWFRKTSAIIPHHLVSAEAPDFPKALQPFRDLLSGRSMLVRKCRPLPVECVVRGYLAGSGWKDYCRTGSVCGIALPAKLRQADRLPAPIFTPSTKAAQGHDENISFDQMVQMVGGEVAEQAREASLRLYQWANQHARKRGIIIADTKFEFGLDDASLMLIDEALTPDSSRFWPLDQYSPGQSPPSYDKQ